MSPLKARIIDRIKAEGPMSVASYMAACLFDATDGFYPTRDPLGADGDFITAPEISQMFGEMLGLWCVHMWRDMGAPPRLELIELGPGRGVMMLDMLRAAKVDPGFLKAANVTLIEASAALQAVQGQTLASSPCPVNWVDSLADAPKGPCIIIGNEFLDCLPIRQFVRKDDAWHERLVAIRPEDETQLIFGLSPLPYEHDDIGHFRNPKNGDLAEVCPGYAQIIDQLKLRLEHNLSSALFIDYGPARSEYGDTLQALKAHTKVDPLDEPGEADLTARVDFGLLGQLGEHAELSVFGPQDQAELLKQIGIEVRALNLSQAQPAAKDKLMRQLHRLLNEDEMGTLFKAMCIQSAGLSIPPGFGHPTSDVQFDT